jgi:branched-chain amino acid transport system substrate-binding protein
MNRNSTIRHSALALLAALGLSASGAQAAEPIKIGAFLSTTGPASFLGDPADKTFKMYVDKINASGGVLGRPIKLTVYDDGGAADAAVTNVKKLLQVDTVDILVGGSTTGTTMAAVPVIEAAGVPYVSVAGAIVITEPVKKWVFKVPHTDRMVCERVFGDMKKRNLSKVAILYDNGGFGMSMRDQCKAVSGSFGVVVIGEEAYGSKDSDMTAQLTKMRSLPGLQAILMAGLGQGPAVATRNYRQLNIELPLYQSHAVASKSFIQLAGEAADGIRLPASAVLAPELLPANDPQKPVLMEYKTSFESRWNLPSSAYGGNAYDALAIVVDAIKRAGSLDREKVRDAIESTKGLVATNGIFNMSPSDHLGIGANSLHLFEIRKGDWALID